MTYIDCLVSVALQMDRMGFLGDDTYCLCHLDLNHAPRNIMVDSQQDGTTAAILDWDSAIFAPKFVSCTPPMWIWSWDDEEDEDEKKANDTPSTPERSELKHLFENAVGQGFLQYAYEPHYRLARKLFEFALHGIHSNEGMSEADELIREWSSLRDPELRLVEAPGDWSNEETTVQKAVAPREHIHEGFGEASMSAESASIAI